MDFSDIRFYIHHFDQLESTNIHAHELIHQKCIEEYAVVSADFQSKGKGQRSRGWESEAAQNMLISIVMPLKIPIQKVVYLNQLIANSIYELLDNLSVSPLHIKWPNDILVGAKKICGILIENSIQGQQINQTIIGIGLNVNQTHFPSFNREATSLSLELGRKFNRTELITELLDYLKVHLNMLEKDALMINQLYHERLYGKDHLLPFTIEDKEVTAMIKGVDTNGQLLLKIDSKIQRFSERELKFRD